MAKKVIAGSSKSTKSKKVISGTNAKGKGKRKKFGPTGLIGPHFIKGPTF